MVDVLLAIIGFMATGFAVTSTVPQIRKALEQRILMIYRYGL